MQQDQRRSASNLPKRIGLIAVHGIGDQGRFHFLDELVRDLQRGFQVAAGAEARVSVRLYSANASLMGAASPTLGEGPGPSAEIIVGREKGETRICIHEVWWGDIIDPRTLFQPLKFLAWGLAMWMVPLKERAAFKAEEEGTVGKFLTEPMPIEGRGHPTRIGVRSRLFFVGYLVAVVGLVLRLVLSLIRLITRQNLPDPVMTAISYMSDIKLYTQPTSPDAVPLDHLGQHARFAIRARVLRAVADVALQKYDQWWVVAHSLGSVVAFSGLTTPDGLIARYLDEARWLALEGKGITYADSKLVPKDTRVVRPAWLRSDACVRRKDLFKHFGGLVTYGSPLDKFAILWPAVIPNIRDQSDLAGGVWLNFHDATDPVAGRLDAFREVDGEPAKFAPKNYAYAGHWCPLYSHLRYLNVPRRSSPKTADEPLSVRLAKWWLLAAQAPDRAPPPFPSEQGRHWPTHDIARRRYRWTWAAWAILALLGPALTALVLVSLGRLGLAARSELEWGWLSYLPSNFWTAFATVALGALLLVAVAGIIGQQLVFSVRDIDPDAPEPLIERLRPSGTSGTRKPATKDQTSYD